MIIKYGQLEDLVIDLIKTTQTSTRDANDFKKMAYKKMVSSFFQIFTKVSP